MSYTKFGEFMRVQRIKHHEVMGDLAKVLNCKIPFISAVESGKRNVPDEWINILKEHYNLTEQELVLMNEAIEESKTQIKFNLTDVSDNKRKALLLFQRSFNEMDEDTVNSIINILNKEDKK